MVAPVRAGSSVSRMSSWGSARRSRARRMIDSCAAAASTSPISAFPGMREVAFVRSPVAHARLRAHPCSRRSTEARLHRARPGGRQADPRGDRAARLQAFGRADPGHRQGPLRRRDRRDVRRATARRGRGHRCRGRASTIEELPAVTDMLAARRPARRSCTRSGATTSSSSSSRTARWTRSPRRAAIKVTREIRTARHCMFPMEGRGVVAYRDRRAALSHARQRRRRCRTSCRRGRRRVPRPRRWRGAGHLARCRRRLRLQGPAQPRGGGARLARAAASAHPVRWLEDCREHLTANANCREHHYHITGYADRDGQAAGDRLRRRTSMPAPIRSIPTSSALEAAQIANLLPGPYDFSTYRCRSAAVATNKCPILPVSRGRAHRRLPRDRGDHGCDRARSRHRAVRGAAAQPGAPGADAVRQRREEAFRQRRLSGMPAPRGRGDRPARRSARGRSAASPTAA